MSTESTAPPRYDLIDSLAGLQAGGTTHRVRHHREKVALATEGSYNGLFDASLPGLSLAERLLVALFACQLSNAGTLGKHYRERIAALGEDQRPDASMIALAQAGTAARIDDIADTRLRAMLGFTRTLILKPIDGDQTALQALPAAGISTPAIVTLAQLIAFLSYQIRLVAGLAAMQAAQLKRQPEARS